MLLLTVAANKQMCPRPPYLPADVHLVRKMALDLDVCRVSVRSFEKKVQRHKPQTETNFVSVYFYINIQ